MFGGVENRLAAALFGIPAVKGVEFGARLRRRPVPGLARTTTPLPMEHGRVETVTNHAGGILGGITSGMPIDPADGA